jgi:hypothetical protein
VVVSRRKIALSCQSVCSTMYESRENSFIAAGSARYSPGGMIGELSCAAVRGRPRGG